MQALTPKTEYGSQALVEAKNDDIEYQITCYIAPVDLHGKAG